MDNNYQNYFIRAFNVEWLKNDKKTHGRIPKLYKIDSLDLTIFNQIVKLT